MARRFVSLCARGPEPRNLALKKPPQAPIALSPPGPGRACRGATAGRALPPTSSCGGSGRGQRGDAGGEGGPADRHARRRGATRPDLHTSPDPALGSLGHPSRGAVNRGGSPGRRRRGAAGSGPDWFRPTPCFAYRGTEGRDWLAGSTGRGKDHEAGEAAASCTASSHR